MNRIAIILLSTALLITAAPYDAVSKQKSRSNRVAEIIREAEAMNDAVWAEHTEQEAAEEHRDLFTPLADGDTLSVALLLPLSVNGRTSRPFVEFYQGVLLAVEDLKMSGRSVVLNLFNTERNAERVQSIIKDEEYQKSHLVVGPVYEELLEAVLSDAELRKVPVISPLVTISKSDSPVLFQMAPDLKRRYDKIDEFIGEDRSVTLIEGESNDEPFREEIINLLTERETDYIIHEYEYEHPSSVEEREKAAEKAIKEVREAAEESGEPLDEAVIDSLSAKVSKGDLAPMLMGEEAKVQRLIKSGILRDEHATDSLDMQPIITEMELEEMLKDIDLTDIPINHTIFILSNNEVEVDRILSALSSARTALIAKSRGSGRDVRELIKYRVVANPEWRRYKNIDRAVYFRNNVVVFSSYLAGRDAEVIREFDSRYAEAFNEFPSLYAYRGFDIVSIFGEGLYNEIEFDMSRTLHKALQSEYRFERDEQRELFINTNWMRESYNPNFTKNIE